MAGGSIASAKEYFIAHFNSDIIDQDEELKQFISEDFLNYRSKIGEDLRILTEKCANYNDVIANELAKINALNIKNNKKIEIKAKKTQKLQTAKSRDVKKKIELSSLLSIITTPENLLNITSDTDEMNKMKKSIIYDFIINYLINKFGQDNTTKYIDLFIKF